MVEEFEDIDLPPENPDEWKEYKCPSCQSLKTRETAAMLACDFYNKENKILVEYNAYLRLALQKIAKKTKIWQSDGHVCEARVDNDACHKIAQAALNKGTQYGK